LSSDSLIGASNASWRESAVVVSYITHIFLQEKAVEAIKQKEEKRKKPKPEEQEGMPQHLHCPPEKRRGDRNPECHEEQQKDLA
jgi:hypothetical protein